MSETFLILRRTERDMIKMSVLACTQSARYYCPILMKLEFFREFFEKYSDIKFHENPTLVAEFFHADGQT